MLSTLAGVGNTEPWALGTNTCGMVASVSSALCRDGASRNTWSATMTSSSASPMINASTKGASGNGLLKVSGPPASTNGCASLRRVRSGGIPEASRMRSSPAISSSYATLVATTGNSVSARRLSYVSASPCSKMLPSASSSRNARSHDMFGVSWIAR